ncbi:ABC transporter permease [Phenylobacterium sp.]|jgi:sulfonate transport system permease protein|uniref:ABC transporter permease n=1 Tax=Phenylobacterium sp. TaxID=1871053 RepID=UPI0037841738
MSDIRISRTLRERLAPLRGWVLPILALTTWNILAHKDAVHAYVFVPLEQVGAALWAKASGGELWSSWAASLGRTGSGLLIGSLAGIALGAIMAVWKLADTLVNPIYQAIRQVPLLGYIPLISLWFGNGESSKLLIISLAAFYPTVLNTYEGIRGADPKHLNVGKIFLANRWQTLRYITLPGALPSIATGVMQAVAFAWLSSIGSEMFFNPGPGLGNMMLNGQAAFRMDVVVLAVIVIGVTGFLTTQLVTVAADRMLRWRSVVR